MAKKPAAGAREEEERWGRRVRELLSAGPGNRLCAECGARGVTYVDISEGSFTCTACSGALRGLNPPHRVKSISMTTFTEQEVAFLQTRGNEVCRKIWMGLYDSSTSTIPDFRDPQKVKEFLQEKYEKKRWYVPPDQVKAAPARSSSNVSNQSTTPEAKPLRTLLGDSVVPALSVGGPAPGQVTQSQARLSQHRVSQQQPQLQGVPTKKVSTDLLADIGGDPFAAPQPSQTFAGFPAFGGQMPAQAGFANFDAFGATPAAPAFGGTTMANQASFHAQHTAAGSRAIANSYSFGGTSVETSNASFSKSSSASFGVFDTQHVAPAVVKSSVPGADRYAPLADLESASSSAKPATGSSQAADYTTAPRAPCRIPDMSNIFGTGTATSTGANSVFGTTTQVPSMPPPNTGPAYGAFTNPFAVSASVPQPSMPSTNPFQTNGMVPGTGYAVSGMTSYPAPQATSGFPQTFQQQAFSQQSPFGHQPNGAGFGGYATARLPQRPQEPPGGVHTNPFMNHLLVHFKRLTCMATFLVAVPFERKVNKIQAFALVFHILLSTMAGPPSGPFASRPPTTNPFL